MKFLIDEDVAIELSRCLEGEGHEVHVVSEILGLRTPDTGIWNHAVAVQAIVITCNRNDFLALSGTTPKTGLIILNRRRTRQAECSRVLRLLANAGLSGIQGNINFA